MTESERLLDWHDRLSCVAGRSEEDIATLNRVLQEIYSRYLDALQAECRKEAAHG